MTTENFSGTFGQTGWICPKCGRVFSPFTTMCPYCKSNDNSNLITATDTDSAKWDKIDTLCDELNAHKRTEEWYKFGNPHFLQHKNESYVFPSTRWSSGPNAETTFRQMYDDTII
jgi:RNA polymerase subunit RPABC4/transcription elongation factor Spt4